VPALDREGSRKLKELAKQVLTFVSRTHEGEDTLDWAEYRLTGPGEAVRLIRQASPVILHRLRPH
jgi:hypothetical protein